MHILPGRMLDAKVLVVLFAGCLASVSSGELHAGEETRQAQIKRSNSTLFKSASPNVVFRLYTSSNADPVVVDPENNSTFATFNFSVCCIVFCVHGYLGNETTSGCYNISQAILNQSSCNIITVDWSQLDSHNYVDDALYKVHEVSDRMAEVVNVILSMGANSSCIHLIGHSLGAHVCAFTCRKAKEPCGWLTGLDPAGPLFFCADAKCRFNASDCVFNEAIHTSATYGTFQAVAQCDLLVNYARQPWSTSPQPGCVNDIGGLCAHFYAVTLYVYAIQNNKALVAEKCAPSLPSLPGSCRTVNCGPYPSSSTDTTYIGPLVNKSCSGVYNVNTNVPVQGYQPDSLSFAGQISVTNGVFDIFSNGSCYLKK
ncbi:hypothetical protein ONE63_007298 [Megalurothrips usitatus]|uniref:Lipase domain-containing protein n=1 Tax=Megalurothrips usitatus TaxID=439358 RepID=A0AAV7XWJ6_9NEOP|nr:hypothetical protein ONE63_007298 [Megalurothrips usitatus]